MMTTLQMVFVGLILVWLGFGFLGALQLEAQKLAWGAIVFFCVVPFIPVVASVCMLI